jgi:branched-chain amino acid aminotransferase
MIGAVNEGKVRATPTAARARPMVWVNGERVAGDVASISALDRGFTLADGIFETMLLRGGAIFRGERHLDRLRDGASVLRIEFPVGVDGWLAEAAYDAAEVSGLEQAAIRLMVSRGADAHGLAPREEATPTVVIAVSALPAFPAAIYEHGLAALTAGARRDERAITAGVKTLAYTETIAAIARAHDAGADEALFLDGAGPVSEASASNIFMVSGGALITPPLTCGVLPGITRAAIVELAPAMGIEVVERPVEPRELAGADEAFLTSSLRGVAPLVRLDGGAIGTGAVGPVTRRVMGEYAALVERECTTRERAR